MTCIIEKSDFMGVKLFSLLNLYQAANTAAILRVMLTTICINFHITCDAFSNIAQKAPLQNIRKTYEAVSYLISVV